jgi:hypothetical protein
MAEVLAVLPGRVDGGREVQCREVLAGGVFFILSAQIHGGPFLGAMMAAGGHGVV